MRIFFNRDLYEELILIFIIRYCKKNKETQCPNITLSKNGFKFKFTFVIIIIS